MRGLLKIFVFIFFISYFSKTFAQVDPTIPLPQRNLQNNLTKPIFNENPFIEQKVPKFKNPNNTPINQINPTFKKNKINEVLNEEEEIEPKEE